MIKFSFLKLINENSSKFENFWKVVCLFVFFLCSFLLSSTHPFNGLNFYQRDYTHVLLLQTQLGPEKVSMSVGVEPLTQSF